MTKGEINLLCVEVEKLLKEICGFLNDEIAGGYMSQNGRSIANNLIEKSKKQLQSISIITTAESSECTSEPYVDMQGYKVNPEQEEPQEVYSDISLFEGESPVNEEYVACPYASTQPQSLPANGAKEGKTGHIYKKEKFFIFGQQKKVYAAVQHTWFLVYMNENSIKPCQMFDLTRYEAKPSMTLKDMKKREESFDLTSFIDSKTYHFTALTAKDMLQWVSAINKPSEKVSGRCLPPVPASPIKLDKSLSESIECMNDYEPLTEYQLKQKKLDEQPPLAVNHKIIGQPLIPLPPRNIPARPVQRFTPRVPSQESLGSTYDPVEQGIINPSHSSSFSDDDSDTIYDNPRKPPPVQDKLDSHVNTNNGIVNNRDFQYDEDELYDYLETPKPVKEPESNDLANGAISIIQNHSPEPAKENEVMKPKPMIKPKILSLRRRRKDNF